MKHLLLQHKLSIAGILLGGVFGFFYWKFVGCSSGACIISSKPFNSIVYFSFLGYLTFNIFKKKKAS